MSITSKANTESRFVWLEHENGKKDLSVEHAVLMYKNFEGRPDRFNPKGGKRSFSLVLSDIVAEELRELGWNVKERPPRDEYEDTLYMTEIVVNLESKFPPKIFLCVDRNGKKKMVALDSSTIKELDNGDFSNIDLIIHPYEHDKDSRFRFKGYLNQLYATQAASTNFGGKYAEYELANDYDPGGPSEDDDGNLPF